MQSVKELADNEILSGNDLFKNLKEERNAEIPLFAGGIFCCSKMNITSENYRIKEKNYQYSLVLEVCGNQFYIKHYWKPVWIGFKSKGGRNDSGMDKEKNRRDAIRRARQNFIKLAENNFNNESDKFITLTPKENIQDLKNSNYEYMKFIQRLKYKYGDIKYLTVIEFQKRGAIHYHMLSNIGYVPNKELREIWGQGFVKINRINHVDDLGAYLIKYMVKSTDKLEKNKSYLRSSNLIDIKRYYDREALKKIKEMNLRPENLTYSKMYKRPLGDGSVSNVDDLRGTIKLNREYRGKNNNYNYAFNKIINGEI